MRATCQCEWWAGITPVISYIHPPGAMPLGNSDGGKQYEDASFGKILTVMMISTLLARVVGITPVLSYIHPRAVEETMYSILTLILRLMLTLIIDVNKYGAVPL